MAALITVPCRSVILERLALQARWVTQSWSVGRIRPSRVVPKCRDWALCCHHLATYAGIGPCASGLGPQDPCYLPAGPTPPLSGLHTKIMCLIQCVNPSYWAHRAPHGSGNLADLFLSHKAFEPVTSPTGMAPGAGFGSWAWGWVYLLQINLII